MTHDPGGFPGNPNCRSALPTADLAEALALLDRFADWRTCEASLLNPDPDVREIALGYLREFAADGDPFSQALLDNMPIPAA